jgi:hypothetical protein
MPAAQGSCRRAISWSSAQGDEFAWAVGPPGPTSPGLGPAVGRKSSSAPCCYAGMELSVHSRSLVTDTMGALVNQQSLQTDLALLFGLVAPQLPEAESIVLAAGLSNADRVWEGDPAHVGDRTVGQLRSTRASRISVGGDFVVPAHRLVGSFGDLGADLAHDILADLRELR